jgi:methylated-DNA-protein-cysteine methyltransferase-like protein
VTPILSGTVPVAPRHLFDDIEAAIRAIPRGQTWSYADIAQVVLGSRSGARTVGWALARCSDDVPWWRVIRADGTLAGANDREQTRRLRAEGVTVEAGRSMHRIRVGGDG